MISLNVESYCDECAEFEPVCQLAAYLNTRYEAELVAYDRK